MYNEISKFIKKLLTLCSLYTDFRKSGISISEIQTMIRAITSIQL